MLQHEHSQHLTVGYIRCPFRDIFWSKNRRYPAQAHAVSVYSDALLMCRSGAVYNLECRNALSEAATLNLQSSAICRQTSSLC